MSAFDFSNCDAFYDKQLLVDTMAGNINRTFTFECFGGGLGGKQQPGPIFQDCPSPAFGAGNFPYTNFCIGGNKQQHACYAGTCHIVDWTATVAPPCSAVIMNYVTVRTQPIGMASPCCNADDCSTPSTKYACDSSRSLQLCVLDGAAAECVDPSKRTICSGKYSADVVLPSGSTIEGSSLTGISTTPSTTASSATGGHSGLSSTDIIAIVTSLVGSAAAVVTIIGGSYAFKKYMRNKGECSIFTIS
ncbi:hypothetical protein FB451DRAFT_1523591 [Mycena latifolia]|nr:hypothetical protein FB451DRAFT_1523591 [Mycena latifolia]